MCFDSLAGSDDVPIVVRRIIFHGTAPRENDTFGAPASRIAGARPCERKAAILTPFFQSDETPADRLMEIGSEHVELQSIMRSSLAVFCLKKINLKSSIHIKQRQ